MKNRAWYRMVLVVFAGGVLGGSENLAAQETRATRPEVLRAAIGPGRAFWDLLHYELTIEVFPETKTIAGNNVVSFRTTAPGQVIQVDLQPPLVITKVNYGEANIEFVRDGNAWFLTFPGVLPAGVEAKVVIFYEGTPIESRNPPWSGGFTFTRDSGGRHFIATTCQGIGASIWWPNKDHGADEPDRGITLHATVPADLTAVANGRLSGIDVLPGGTKRTFHWDVKSPINNYSVNLNIGDYVSWNDVYHGETGPLDVQYWVLRQDEEKARRHFVELPRTLEAFEYWFGPYPFAQDGFKLVQVPYLGMEHQSSVTYGNGFVNGYRGMDLSGTGVGMKFDFIIVHESAHEWFGNNISMNDAADMWIHESFANYAESLFVEYFFTRKEATDYVIGTRRNIRNDRPIIGKYGLNQEGSGDMYYKGGNLLHTLRHVIDNDVRWRRILRGLNQEFRWKTIDTADIEAYISKHAGLDLKAFFDQYLRTKDVPVFEFEVVDKVIRYRWASAVSEFAMPIRVLIDSEEVVLKPTTEFQELRRKKKVISVSVDRNFYVSVKRL